MGFGGTTAIGTPASITALTAKETVLSLYTGMNLEENLGYASSVGLTPLLPRERNFLSLRV